MNVPESKDGSDRGRHAATPLLATEGWHRLVTAICLLGCVGLIFMGIGQFFDPPMDHRGSVGWGRVRGVKFILLGLLGCRYLIRQFKS